MARDQCRVAGELPQSSAQSQAPAIGDAKASALTDSAGSVAKQLASNPAQAKKTLDAYVFGPPGAPFPPAEQQRRFTELTKTLAQRPFAVSYGALVQALGNEREAS